MIKLKFDLHIGDGFNEDLEKFEDELQGLAFGDYKIFVSDNKPQRTSSQNKYLWGVVYKLIADETGFNINQIHELMKESFGEIEFLEYQNPETYETIRKRINKSTTDYDTKEFTTYIENIKIWALEFLNIRIPGADEIPDELLIEMNKHK